MENWNVSITFSYLFSYNAFYTSRSSVPVLFSYDLCSHCIIRTRLFDVTTLPNGLLYTDVTNVWNNTRWKKARRNFDLNWFRFSRTTLPVFSPRNKPPWQSVSNRHTNVEHRETQLTRGENFSTVAEELIRYSFRSRICFHSNLTRGEFETWVTYDPRQNEFTWSLSR